jgi:hypothetical protein
MKSTFDMAGLERIEDGLNPIYFNSGARPIFHNF